MTTVIDQKYFDNYGGLETSKPYNKIWSNHTINISKIFRYFKKLNLNVTSFFDIGAADGSLINEISKYIPARGLEIFENIVPNEMRKFIDIGNACDYNYSYSDVMCLNGYAYYTEKELEKLFTNLPCKYIICTGLDFDLIHFYYPKGILPNKIYEINLKPYSWWIKFFDRIGFRIIINDDFYILEKGKNISFKKIKDYFNIKYYKEHIMFNDVKLYYNERKIIIENASEKDLVQLTYFLCGLRNNGVTAIGNYNFVPGWANTLKGNLNYIFPPDTF